MVEKSDGQTENDVGSLPQPEVEVQKVERQEYEKDE